MGLGIRTASRKIFRSAAFALGCQPIVKSDRADVLAFIQKLRPIDCGIDLIRVGSAHDGGYLIPDDLEGIEYCFSPGVNTTADFESQLADRHIRSFLADYSVERSPVSREEFTFDKKFLGSSDYEPYFTLSSWKDKYLRDYAGDMILQMDIEGAEFEVILSTPETLLDQFRIIVVEFHGLNRIFDAFTLRYFSACFEKLLRSFRVVHIHPNDCEEVVTHEGIEIPIVMEFTFLNKKRIQKSTPQTVFPHRLDARNTPHGRSLSLAKIWYS